MVPPRIQAVAMGGYGPAQVPPFRQPQPYSVQPEPQAPRQDGRYDPNMTLEEAMDGGFNEEVTPPRIGQLNSSGVDIGGTQRGTGYGADSRIQ